MRLRIGLTLTLAALVGSIACNPAPSPQEDQWYLNAMILSQMRGSISACERYLSTKTDQHGPFMFNAEFTANCLEVISSLETALETKGALPRPVIIAAVIGDALPGIAPGEAGTDAKWLTYKAMIPRMTTSTIEMCIVLGDKVRVVLNVEVDWNHEFQSIMGNHNLFLRPESGVPGSWVEQGTLRNVEQYSVSISAGQVVPYPVDWWNPDEVTIQMRIKDGNGVFSSWVTVEKWPRLVTEAP